MSSSDDDYYEEKHCNIKRKNCKERKPKCYEAIKIRAGEVIVTGCLIVQGEQADPDWIRGPIITTSTMTGNMNNNLATTTTTTNAQGIQVTQVTQVTPTVVPVINNNATVNNINLMTTNANNIFVPNPPLPLPAGTQIPQGVFATSTAPFFGSRMPNYVNIMETQNITQMEQWKCAREIRSKIYLQNISGFNTYNVVFALIAYSYNGYNENLQILDMDMRTMAPGSFNTFRVDWQRGTSILPFQSDALQILIQTSVLLVNQVFTQQALADLVTFNFIGTSLKFKIILVY